MTGNCDCWHMIGGIVVGYVMVRYPLSFFGFVAIGMWWESIQFKRREREIT